MNNLVGDFVNYELMSHLSGNNQVGRANGEIFMWYKEQVDKL